MGLAALGCGSIVGCEVVRPLGTSDWRVLMAIAILTWAALVGASGEYVL
jgi:hypothetical protein